MEKYDCLRLDDQLCFPLYACSKEIVRRYKPFLDPLGLTYTQYLVMMVLWEQSEITVRDLGERLYLDSGTLTPVLKKLESRGYLERKRCDSDERCVILSLTEEGNVLKDRALDVPEKMGRCVPLKPEDAAELYRLLYGVLGALQEENDAAQPELGGKS